MEAQYPPGSRVRGKVTNVTDFGVFVELAEGIEGMVHVSQLSRERVESAAEHYQAGQQVEAEVLQVDANARRIALSIRSLLDSQDQEEMQQYMSQSGGSSRTTLGDLINQQLVRGKKTNEDDPDDSGSSDY